MQNKNFKNSQMPLLLVTAFSTKFYRKAHDIECFTILLQYQGFFLYIIDFFGCV